MDIITTRNLRPWLPNSWLSLGFWIFGNSRICARNGNHPQLLTDSFQSCVAIRSLHSAHLPTISYPDPKKFEKALGTRLTCPIKQVSRAYHSLTSEERKPKHSVRSSVFFASVCQHFLAWGVPRIDLLVIMAAVKTFCRPYAGMAAAN